MRLEALPDFDETVRAGPDAFLRVAGDGTRFVYLPETLEVADRPGPAQGPDFSLEFVRGQDPSAPPAPYGVLDFRLSAPAPPPGALVGLRDLEPRATLVPPTFVGGFFRLQFLAQAQGGDPELEEPTRLASNGLDNLRVIRRLSAEQAVLLEDVLRERTTTFAGLAELEVAGQAPRAPGRLEVRPATLLHALTALADSARRLVRARIVEFWMRDVAQLPIVPIGGFDEGDAARRAEALADWTIARLGRYVPASDADLLPTVQLKPADAGDDEPVVWDVSVPRAVSRLFLLRSNPFLAAQRAVAEQGLDAVCTRTVVPPLQTGVVVISVALNLPRNLEGVLKLGVDLVAPPHPPLRVHPLTASLLFDDPASVQTVQWRFSPREEVTLRVSTFVIVRDAAGVVRLAGPARSHTGLSVLVGVDDFAMRFVTVRANAALLQQATLAGSGEYVREGGGAVAVTFQLDLGEPAVCLALPADASEGRLMLEARSRSSAEVVVLGPLPLATVKLDLFSFREYGPHRVAIETTFDRELPLAAVDLVPDEDSGDQGPAQEVTVIAFTPDRPRAEWTYFASSPFRAGYRYRWHETAGRTFEWSQAQSPFETLRLATSALA